MGVIVVMERRRRIERRMRWKREKMLLLIDARVSSPFEDRVLLT